MQLTEEDLNKLSRLNLRKNNIKHHNTNSILYRNSKYLYKLVDAKYFFKEEFERNIDYLINNNIPNTPKVYEKIYMNNEFYGYVMEYIENSLTFREAINKDMSTSDKIKAISDIHNALKYLHQNNILLGDIHLDNFLYSNGNGYIIDLDYIRFKGDEHKFTTCYDIKITNNSPKINFSSFYTDTVKIMLASISLLFNIDLENYIPESTQTASLEDVFTKLIVPTNNIGLINYFIKIMNKEIVYFDDYLKEDNYFNDRENKRL